MNRNECRKRPETIQQALREIRRLDIPSITILCKAPKGIKGQTGALGIFPASFNPPTKAHVALIREARKQANLDEILVLLDLQAMDKSLTGASYEERINMIEMVFRKDPKISIGISNRGLFLDKIEPLKGLYPARVHFTFIVGFDTILRVMDKKYYKNRKKSLNELFDQSCFLVTNRDDYEETAFEILFRERELKEYLKKITYFTLPARFSFHSSSSVRNKIAEGQPVHSLVPASVLRYIEKKRLYQHQRSRRCH